MTIRRVLDTSVVMVERCTDDHEAFAITLLPTGDVSYAYDEDDAYDMANEMQEEWKTDPRNTVG